MKKDEWQLIYEKYHKSVYLYALSRTKNWTDAEDLLQETFVKAFLSYENTGSLKGWLVKVLRNEFYNLYRKRKKELLDNGELLCTHSSSSEDLLEGMIDQEERKTLFLAITDLPVQMKEILMESIYFQLSDEEIAKAHGLTKENVRQIRCRAKKKLISSMKEGM